MEMAFTRFFSSNFRGILPTFFLFSVFVGNYELKINVTDRGGYNCAIVSVQYTRREDLIEIKIEPPRHIEYYFRD